MSALAGASGPLATALISLLIAVEELGVPLPMFPGDGLLLAGGVLLATNQVSPALFVPAVFLADVAGSFAGYGWCRRLGAQRLERLADRLHAAGALRRATDLLRRSGAAGVIIGRLLPGTRVYTNLVAGAVQMSPQRFSLGLVPASAIWVSIFVSIGYALGTQVSAYVHQAEVFALLLAVQTLLVVVIVVMLRRLRVPVAPRPQPVRRLLAAAVLDLGVIAAIAAALRFVVAPQGIGVTVAIVAGALLYGAIARLVGRQTLGEWVFGTSYARRRKQ